MELNLISVKHALALNKQGLIAKDLQQAEEFVNRLTKNHRTIAIV